MGGRGGEEVNGSLLLSDHVTRLTWALFVVWGVVHLRTLCVLVSEPKIAGFCGSLHTCCPFGLG